MVTFEAIKAEHAANNRQTIDKYLMKYANMPNPKNRDTLALFIIQNVRDISSEMSSSLLNAMVKTVENGIQLNEAQVDELRAENFAAATIWQQEIYNLYMQL